MNEEVNLDTLTTDNNMKENEIGEKYLPIGTVVLLNGGTKRAMIIGFCCMDQNDNNKMYDYAGCIYPEGMISSDKNILFNHDQIQEVYAFGYSDDEEKQFQERLKRIIEKINQNDNQ